jgi:hypothetical protein
MMRRQHPDREAMIVAHRRSRVRRHGATVMRRTSSTTSCRSPRSASSRPSTRWDPERGVAFATYAVPTIFGELRRTSATSPGTCVRPPRGVQDLCLAVAKTRAALYAGLGREPGSADYAQRLGRSPDALAGATAKTDRRWLRAQIGSGGGGTELHARR